MKLAGIMTGRRNSIAWNQGNEMVDFYDIKGVVETLFECLSISKYTVEAGEHYMMHPGKTAVFRKGKEVIATIGEVHPAVADAFGIKQKMYVFEMDIDTLMKYTARNFHFGALPKYPAISRDLAMLVDAGVNAGDVEQVIEKNGGKYFKKVTLFDVYTGKQIADGKKSLAFTMQFQSNTKTLTDEEADEAFQNILKAVEKNFQAELRA
ncbi:MAG: phenylalanine--tRNA ligase subunit beta, partial [Selenomonadaceae bacterium]|nr:phenylalanine--tRNA ligase subunit beta [Selenomonadaceae bacterium]